MQIAAALLAHKQIRLFIVRQHMKIITFSNNDYSFYYGEISLL